MIGEDYQGSLKPLSECCHLITTNFGEMDPQLADPAYYYGSSLLEVVRATQNVFGGGVEEKVEGEKADKEKLETENDQLEDARSDYQAALEIFKLQLGKNDRKV